MNSNISCTPHKFYLNFGVNIIVHIIFIFTILAFLFMLFISKISSNAINREITDLINENINKEIENLSPEQKKLMNSYIKKEELKKLSELYNEEDDTRRVNNFFVYSSMKITIVLLIIMLILIIATSKLLCHKLPLKNIFIENIIIFTGVGIIEFVFFKYIILKYIPVEPSFMSKYLLKTIKKHFA